MDNLSLELKWEVGEFAVTANKARAAPATVNK